jgi:hypothetical protein
MSDIGSPLSARGNRREVESFAKAPTEPRLGLGSRFCIPPHSGKEMLPQSEICVRRVGSNLRQGRLQGIIGPCQDEKNKNLPCGSGAKSVTVLLIYIK